MLTRNVAQLDKLIVKNLHSIRAIPADVIVHCPRSGTIPAALIATYLYKPFCSVDEYCAGIINTRKSEYTDLNKILLVDDSICTGKQMEGFIERIKSARPGVVINTLAVYRTDNSNHSFSPDMILETHKAGDGYIYTWFMWKTGRLRKCAVDMDGVLCRDCLPHEDDDGPEYLKFLSSAELKFKPAEYLPNNDIIGAIVTSRLEKYRPQTEAWLKKHNIKYKKLIMGPWKNKEDRRGKQAIWKAGVYKRPEYKLFIESSEKEARDIARFSGKPVFCVDSGERY